MLLNSLQKCIISFKFQKKKKFMLLFFFSKRWEKDGKTDEHPRKETVLFCFPYCSCANAEFFVSLLNMKLNQLLAAL